MSELTAEQRQQRCDWAREMWGASYHSREWQTVARCIRTVRPFDPKWAYVLLSEAFEEPYQHNDFLDAIFEEWANRKLLGEIT